MIKNIIWGGLGAVKYLITRGFEIGTPVVVVPRFLFTVSADVRSFRVDAVVRRYAVGPDTRSYQPISDIRTFAVPKDNRTFIREADHV